MPGTGLLRVQRRKVHKHTPVVPDRLCMAKVYWQYKPSSCLMQEMFLLKISWLILLMDLTPSIP